MWVINPLSNLANIQTDDDKPVSSYNTKSIIATAQGATLSPTQQWLGHGGCSGSGAILSLVGSSMLYGNLTQDSITKFSAMYSVGNILALLGTIFHVDLQTHCLTVFESTRAVSAACYLIMLIVVGVVAGTSLKSHVSPQFVTFLVFVEHMAAHWYGMSHANPDGRQVVKNMLPSWAACPDMSGSCPCSISDCDLCGCCSSS